jgi:hypothetical protein
LVVSLSIYTDRFSKKLFLLVYWKTNHLIWNKDFFLNTQVIWDKGSNSLTS